MNYCLITPYLASSKYNVGWDMITAGIKYLIRKADSKAVFEYVNMFEIPKDHDFTNYDRLVICGNPRYDDDRVRGEWLYEGLLEKLVSLKIPLIDAWQGAGCPLGMSLTDSVDLLSSNDKNKNILKLLHNAKIITRDTISQTLNEKHGLNSTLLPCSSFWANLEYGICRNKNKTENIVVVFNMDGYDGIQGILKTMLRTHRMIATATTDSNWCISFGLKHDLILDPIELLKLYSISQEVISFRLHAAIPAAGLGCSVYMAAIDSRAEACELFDIPYGDYRNGIGESKIVNYIAPIDISKIIKE